ncbi:MAG TPA: type II secretion system F family protein, partial [Dissulfurispiraceae bacterium]|nr:type II secretion system F family protein [Dissulfurispiraceae bacterium]
MATKFVWTAQDAANTQQKGEVSAASREEAFSSLARKGYTNISLQEKKAGAFAKQRSKRITEKDIVVFTRQFATLFNSGIPIVQGLDILAKQTENKSFGAVIGQIKTDVETGSTLSDAMARHPKLFDDLFVNLVAAGETGGVLDDILQRLATYIEKMMKLKKKVKGALIYPSIVIAVAVLVILLIMVFVIPVFASIFGEMGVALPLPTRIVVGASNFLGGIGGLIVLFILVGTAYAILHYRRTEQGRKVTDRLFLQMPLVGPLLRKVAVSRFSRTLGTLIQSGVPILDALEICAKSSGNRIVEEVIYDVRKDVASGRTLAEPLAKTPSIFSTMVVQMVNVGESTGALDQMLIKVADFFDDEVDNTVANLMTMLEPL